MTARPILRMGNPLLRRRARELAPEEISEARLAPLIADMVDSLDVSGGIGLAAPQIGVELRIAIIRLPAGPSRYGELPEIPLTVCINPVIEIVDAKEQGFWEGCLSVPGLRGWVERPRAIRVRWTGLDGAETTLEVEDFPATVFQHEFDHLDGVLYVDRIRDTRLLVFEDELEALLSGDSPEAGPQAPGDVGAQEASEDRN